MSDWLDNTDNWLGNIPIKNKRPAKKIDIDADVKNQVGVAYFVLRCPSCNSSRCRCYSSNPPIRYHKCNGCGYNFKSVEQEIGKC